VSSAPAPAAAMRPAGAPTGALFRLMLVRWGTLGRFGLFALFLAFMAWGHLDGELLPAGVGVEVALAWLLAPALAFLAGFLPRYLADGFAESPLTRALPGLEQGFLRATLWAGGCVGIGAAATALHVGIAGWGAVAVTALALVHFLIAATATGIGGRRMRPANPFLLSPGGSPLLIIVGYVLVLYFDPTLPVQVGTRWPILVTMASLVLLTLLLLGLVWTRPVEWDWKGATQPWESDPMSLWELFGRDPRPRAGWMGRLSMGVPPSAPAWRERRLQAGVEAGHYERARMDLHSPGLLVEWLALPVVLIGVAWFTGAFPFFLLGAVVACVFPGLVPVGTLRYPLSRRDRARLTWLAHMVQGFAGVTLAGALAVVVSVLSPAVDFGLPGGTSPVLLLGLVLAWLPVAMLAETLQHPYRLGIESPRPPASLRILLPAVPIFAGVVVSAVGFGRAGLSGPVQILPALGLLALTLHGAGWLFLRWHFGRCDLGPADA